MESKGTDAAAQTVLFRGCEVVDGTGAPRFRADVALAGGRIAAVGADTAAGLDTDRVVDASGLVLAPGFIDMHAHSDLALLADKELLAKTSQGVTLEVLGQDGLSYAPVDDSALKQLRQQISGWHGDPEELAWDWRTVGEYLDRIDEGCAVNAVYLMPQGTLRMMCVGNDDRPATAAELDAMRRMLAEGLQQGAVGMSSGLTYTPGMYADTDELVELCRVVAEYGGYYSPHHRSYGAGALEAYEEMIRVSERSGCPLHLAHATLNFSVNTGRAPDLLQLIDDASARGVDITLDSYPYLPGATTLAALLPSWAASGGPDALVARLRDPAARERMAADLEIAGSDGCHGVAIDWSAIQISGTRHAANRALAGLSVAQAAARSGKPPAQFCFDLLLADDLGVSCLLHVGNEENVRAILRHPAHLVGSDGLLIGERPHPRAWGTFPRYLGHYVRDEGLLTLEECVAQMTGRAARRLGLSSRGRVAPGLVADVVLFDPETVADRATFEQPRRTATGIPYVLVNGEFVIDGHRRTSAAPGRALRRDAGRRP
ncbi:D-aminoacylase [Actinocrinis sp.]|uniref:N-acyl-D-amino-acid deacylase family protein n=1 Tax=Actinocrinis sp. TaxID=1920516 RepID=UPI002CBD8159|nr:D-aminoacylase [Actinocrinis sp.]HXR74090.1 D-aminoacylase [Actinocrinis sp.]